MICLKWFSIGKKNDSFGIVKGYNKGLCVLELTNV